MVVGVAVDLRRELTPVAVVGRAGLDEYHEAKHVYWNLEPSPADWFGRGDG